MSLTKSYTQMQASASNGAGSTTTSSSITIGYGSSIICLVTNGGTGPTIGCDSVLQVSNDNSTFFEKDRRTAGVASATSYRFVWDLGIAGAGGDWIYARIQFTNNTAQAVTVQADAESTTSL